MVVTVDDTTDAFATLDRVATLLDRRAAGEALADSLRRTWRAVAASVAGRPRPRVLHVVSVDPPMGAGPRTFIGQLIAVAGGDNVVADGSSAWPTLSLEALVADAPDVLLSGTRQSRDALLAELRTRAGWRELSAVRAGRVVVLDPDLLERPGPRLGEAALALRDALHGPTR
jgi:iron complex transport system substrate-binding protein